MTLSGVTACASLASADAAPPAFACDPDDFPGQKPWTSEDFCNHPADFQFAVIGDRTGGADPRRIFDRALEQLGLLRPQFVVTVGDLIEGYSTNQAKIRAQWDEVDAMTARLEVPLFRTVGNHDLGNDAMREVWNQRYGPTWYHFIYGGVLFLVLDTEDPPRPAPDDMEQEIETYKRLQVDDPERARAMLEEFMAEVAGYLGEPAGFSAQQVADVRRALADHRDVRWTFVLLHEPAWKNPSANFLAIEAALRDRPHTFFAGHLHYYEREVRNGRDYITMGPAGASFHKEGPGNVDHVCWVTMTPAGPRIAKIALDAIYDVDGRDLEIQRMYDRSSSGHE